MDGCFGRSRSCSLFCLWEGGMVRDVRAIGVCSGVLIALIFVVWCCLWFPCVGEEKVAGLGSGWFGWLWGGMALE